MSKIQSSNTDDQNQRKLEAQQKTIEILKKKVIDHYNGGSQSIIHQALEKSKRRDEENRRKRELMRVRNEELSRHSQKLEAEVAQRIATSKTILNNVTFGFIIVDRDLKVNAEYTRSCRDLFGRDDLASAYFPDLLGLSERDRENYSLCVDQVFEDLLPEDVSLEQIPVRFLIDGKTLKVEGSLIRDDEQNIQGLLYSISDITDLELAQHQARINHTLVNILRQKPAFQAFIYHVREQLNEARSLVSNGDQKTLRRIVHTIKGNAASYDLFEVINVIHRIEDASIIHQDHIREIASSFKNFLENHQNILGIDFDNTERDAFEVSARQIANLREIISTVQGEKAEKLQGWTAQVLQRPALNLIGPVEEFVNRLAQRLGKKVKFSLEGAETLVDAQLTKGVFDNLVHLIRNAVDHGIESPNSRLNKAETAEIKVKIAHSEDSYHICVEDDGRGVNVEVLTQRALDRGFINQADLKNMNESEKLQMIFIDGLSSAERTTEISGRGVGMSAVKDAIDRVKGRIEIDSQQGSGTKVHIQIPIPDSMFVEQNRAA